MEKYFNTLLVTTYIILYWFSDCKNELDMEGETQKIL